MANIMVLGDTHHYLHGMEKALDDSKNTHAERIIQVGDFGLDDHTKKGVLFLDGTNEKLRHYGRKMYALGGNHENWDHWMWYLANMPKDEHGFTMIRSHIFLAPRIHFWMWEGKKFQIVAGAVSIDKEQSRERERNGEAQRWWPQEQITDAEIWEIPVAKKDYLFSHDCSTRTPMRYAGEIHMESHMHRQRIDEALRRTTPTMHFHGHMHHRYEWDNRISGDQWVKTIGLTCNGAVNSWGILDTETDEFTFNYAK